MSNNSFGDFGKLPKRQFSISSIIKIFFVICILAAVPSAVSGWSKFYVSIAEREAPQISFENPPVGIGLAPVTLNIRVKDLLSGLDKVVIRLKTDSKTITLFEKSYPKRVEEDFLAVKINPKELSLTGKYAVLLINAFDRSIWSTSGSLQAEIPVDLKSPKIQTVSTTNYITVGGVGLVFYKVIGEKPAISGVKLGEELYQGFSALYFDKIFDSAKNLYFAFFPVPLSCNEENCEFRIFATDEVGNKSTAKFPYELTKKIYSTFELDLSPEVIETALPKLVDQYNSHKRKEDPAFLPLKFENLDESRLMTLPVVLMDFNIEKQAKILFSRPSSTKLWMEQFFYPGGTVSKPRFADNIKYKYLSITVGSLTSPGILFTSRAGTEIRATNYGRVIFSGDFGLLGKSIIVDHGFGLSTVYSSLGKLGKVEGDKVSKGEVIGLSGQLGLEDRSGCIYQTRMHGVPVRPEEWWDPGWIKNRVFGQLDEAKKAAGFMTIN